MSASETKFLSPPEPKAEAAKPAEANPQQALPAPQRQTAEPPIQAMAMLSMQMENSLRAVLGFSYDVGAQEKRLEQSGRAILARQAQGEVWGVR